METIEINPERINFLLNLFSLEESEFFNKINESRKRLIAREEIFSKKVKKSLLKEVDKIFDKGLSFYTNPQNIEKTKNTSIFFRKDKFNIDLNLEAKRRIHRTESEIDYLSSLTSLADFKINRKLKLYKLSDDPVKIASELKSELYPARLFKDDKTFLEELISQLSNKNILVKEFIEAHNKKEKSNISGFFIKPYGLVLKRQQKTFKREIFTLIHELGHYLLGAEDIDDLDFNDPANDSGIERWCDSFAFSFLADADTLKKLNEIPKGEIKYDHGVIKKISNELHISRLAIFVYLAKEKRITWSTYNKIKNELEEEYQSIQEQEKLLREKDPKQNKGYGRAKEIFSPLEKNIYSHAYLKGVVDEYDLINHFKVEDIETILNA